MEDLDSPVEGAAARGEDEEDETEPAVADEEVGGEGINDEEALGDALRGGEGEEASDGIGTDHGLGATDAGEIEEAANGVADASEAANVAAGDDSSGESPQASAHPGRADHEGLDTTFEAGPSGSGDEDGVEEMEEEVEDDGPDPIVELQDKYDQLLELNERAAQHNVALQRRVIQRKMHDKSYDTAEKQSEGKVTEHKYQNALHNVHSVRLKLRLQQVKAARMSEELKNQLEAKRAKAMECRDSFQDFKRQVARNAEYSRTGRKIPEKIIQEVEEFELDKDAEVEEVRGSNISLKNRKAKLEQALRKKDELAENLHVIDFEQLKIENQTLNEKIEERNEELHKLRKKTTVTVQIITHMREKVQFVQQEYQVLKGELAQLDQELAAQRDLVAKTKHERDEHRSEYGKLKQQTGIMNSEHLTRDFEARAEHNKTLKEDIAQLKQRHGQMLQFIKQHGGKV